MLQCLYAVISDNFRTTTYMADKGGADFSNWSFEVHIMFVCLSHLVSCDVWPVERNYK